MTEEEKEHAEFMAHGVRTVTEIVYPRFSVSLVYIKNIPNGCETALRVLVTTSSSKEEALGKAMLNFEDEMKDFNLCNKVVIKINEV